MGEISIIPSCCPFGPALVMARLNNNISQSRLGILAECNVSSLRRIERGQVQPSVCLSIRLVRATRSSIRDFFNTLAKTVGFELACNSTEDETESVLQMMLAKMLSSGDSPNIMSNKAVFGHLYKQYRVWKGISQRDVAKAANYNLRNILNVETKGQEPGIMTAIALVAAAGCPVGVFFQVLSEYIKEIHFN